MQILSRCAAPGGGTYLGANSTQWSLLHDRRSDQVTLGLNDVRESRWLAVRLGLN
jgi:hypothetical protein